MKLSKEKLIECLKLYGVTDRRWLKGGKLADQVKKTLDGGTTMIQLREKALDKVAFLQEAIEIGSICRSRGIPFIINDNVEIAVGSDADGVHVGQSDMEAGNIRKLIGGDNILGVSAQTVEQAVLAEKNGADYLGVGAVFPTDSKDDAELVPVEVLKEICKAVDIPVVAIGGITADNLRLLKDSGIVGAALISALFGQKDIEAETRHMRYMIDDILK